MSVIINFIVFIRKYFQTKKQPPNQSAAVRFVTLNYYLAAATTASEIAASSPITTTFGWSWRIEAGT